MQCELVFGQPGTSSAEGMVATAMRIVNAVPHVCDAPPGLVSCLDLSRRLHGTPVPADFLHEVSRASKLGFLGSRMLRALAVSVLFGPSPSGRSILSPATAKWGCDTLLRANGWPGRFRALMSLLAGA